MSAKPRLLVPYGLKTLLEGLSRAVLKINPANIAQFALVYFTELLQYRDACPSLDMKDLVQEFQKGKFKEWPETTDDLDSKRMTPQCTEKVLHDSGLFSEMSDSRRTIPQFTGREQASGMTTPQFTGREQASGMATPQFTGMEPASGMTTPQFTGREQESGMTTPQFTGREQASGMATPQFTGTEPASGMTIPQFTLRESASGMTTPQFTGREQESGMTTPQFTGREQASEMTTPQFTGREQESGMTTPQFTGREPASGMTTPQFTLRESASGMTTPQFTGREQESGMTTPQFDSQTNKYVTGQNILESPSADASQMQRTFRDKITQCPSLHRDISNPIISSHGPEALYYPLPSIQSSAEQEEPSKVLSKYSSADNTRQGRDKSPHKAQQSLSDVQRMDTRTFQGLPINQEHLDRVESHALRKPPEFTFEKSDQDTTPSDAALMPDNPNQISHTRSVMYPPDRVMSKTLQADGLPANVVRIVSKTSHYPLAEQFMPSDSSTATAPRSAISSTKQVIDSKFYIEMATTVPPTRAPSQFKVMSGAAERSQRIPKQQPSAPYYELHLAVQNQNEGEPSDSAYVPAMESSVARSFGAISDTHTKIEAKIVQDEKSTLYYNTPVDMRSGSRYPDEPVARVMPYKPPSRGPPQYNPDSVQYDGEVPYYVEQIPQEILHPAPEAATHLYQAPVEQPAYRMMDTENYNPSYQQDASQSPKLGFTDNMGYYNPETYDSQKNYTDQGEREPAKMWTLYRLTDMNQQKPYTPPHQPNAPMFLQNAGEQPPQCNQEYSVNQAYTENMMSTQRSNYQESQFPHGMPQTAAAGAQSVANAPAYTMDEPKRGETHPYLLTGSKVQHKNNWKYIPVHAPVAQNEINAQRKYTTVPIPEALPGIGHPPSQAHDRNIQADPVYYSVLVPLDESHRIASAQSFTHITGQRHHPIYASSHGVSVAVATAASRRPSSAWIGQHHKLSNAGSGQQNMFKGGYGRPPEQNPVSKSRSEWKAPEDTWQS